MNVSSSAAIESVIAAQQGAVQSQIAYALAAKGQQASEAAGDAALQLLAAASPAGLAEGKGGNLDVTG